jgi:RNA methyltransferase, TrmH family
MQIITSKDNEIVKEIRRLKEKKYRDINNEYIVEGIKLVKEAIGENVIVKTIVICEECIKDGSIEQNLLYEIAKFNCIYVTEKIFSNLTDVQNPQGVLAVISKQVDKLQIDYSQDLILVLDNIQDPGNLGTIMRTADSVGLTQILVSKGTADVFNPKVIRSTMGAIFRVNIIETENIIETIKNIKKNKFEILATSLENSESIYSIDYKKKAIVIGNEANGVSKEILEISDKKVKIPMLRKNRKFKCCSGYVRSII